MAGSDPKASPLGRTPVIGGLPGADGQILPRPVPEAVAFLTDIAGDGETHYGEPDHDPVELTRDNLGAAMPPLVVNNLVVDLPGGGRLRVEGLTLRGTVDTFPRQVVDQVAEIRRADAFIRVLEEARADPALRRAVAEWLKARQAPAGQLPLPFPGADASS